MDYKNTQELNKKQASNIAPANKVLISPTADSIILTILYVILPPLWITAFLGLPIYKQTFKNKVTTAFNCYVLPPLAAITVFFTVFYFKGIYPFGKKTIAWCDMTQQGVPYLMNFKNILEGNDNLFWSMANAAGMDGWSLFRAYFVRPFNYLILLVDHSMAMEFVTIITVLKLAACSATAMFFFRTCIKKLNSSVAFALSLMYSFCAYGTMYYQIINWPDSMYVMPLYFTGLYLLIKEHKIALYAVSLAYVMLNFSFGFMTVIATLLLVGYYFFISKDTNELKRTAFEFTAGSGLAAMLCAPGWLSFFSAFNNSARGVNLKDALESSVKFSSKDTVYPLLMSTAFMFIAVFVYKSYKKQPLSRALYFLYGMMLIPMVIEPINKMWHAGSYTGFPSRYAYIIIFAGLAIAGLVLAKDDEVLTAAESENTDSANKKLSVGICASILLCSVCYALYKFVFAYTKANFKAMGKYATTLWGDSTSYKNMLVVMGFILLAYGICYCIYKKGWINKRIFAMFLLVIVVCEAYVSINTYIVPATSKVNTTNFRAYGDLAYRVNDDNFYRVKNNQFLNATYSISEANFPGAIGYNCMGHYSSLTSETYLYAAKAYGYSSVWMKVDSYGGTKFSDALFNIKYEIGKTANMNAESAVYSNEKYYIGKTEYYMPLGVFTPSNNIIVDVEDVTRMQLQERVYDALTGGRTDLFTYVDPSKKTNCKIAFSGGKYNITTSGSTAYIEYNVSIDGTKTLYFDCFDEFSNKLSEKINGSFEIYVNNTKKSSSYPKDTLNGLINLGTYTDTSVSVKLKVKKSVSARSFGLYLMNDELLAEAVENVSSANLKQDGNSVKGNYTAEQNGYLFVSVPYVQNYSCKVNGKTVKAIEAFGGFTAIPVTSGKNSISITYTPSMAYEAIALMIFGVVISIALLVLFKKRNIQNCNVYEGFKALIGEKAVNTLSTIGYIGVFICFAIVFVMVYVYPLAINLGKYF